MAVPASNQIKIIPDVNMRQLPGDDLPSRVSATSDDVVTQVITVSGERRAARAGAAPLMPQNAQLGAVNSAQHADLMTAPPTLIARASSRASTSPAVAFDVIPL